jgi:hypothetical protein
MLSHSRDCSIVSGMTPLLSSLPWKGYLVPQEWFDCEAKEKIAILSAWDAFLLSVLESILSLTNGKLSS